MSGLRCGWQKASQSPRARSPPNVSPLARTIRDMGKRSLLSKINHEAIDGDLSRALRLCLQLGGETGSDKLREWANLELNGYKGQTELPDYRIIHAPLQVDAAKIGGTIQGWTISNWQLPEFARDAITDEVLMMQSAPALIEMEKDARKEGVARLSPPGASDESCSGPAGCSHVRRTICGC